MAINGGRESWLGAIIGAYLVTWLPVWLGFIGLYQDLFFGLILVAVMLFFPDGLLGAIQLGVSTLRLRRKQIAT
jgi:branched-chain amino acid transport system permease protein